MMKEQKIRRLLRVGAAIVCTLGCALPTYAVEWADDIIPDDYVFSVPEPSYTVIVGGGNRAGVDYSYSPSSDIEEPDIWEGDSTSVPDKEENDSDCSTEDFAKIHLEEINRIRQENGLSVLKTDPTLTAMAQERAEEYQSGHKRADGSKWSTIFQEYETERIAVAENWVGDSEDPYEQMRSLMESDGHRANILKERAEYVGIGVKWNEDHTEASVVQLYAR